MLDACARAYFRNDDERLRQWKRYVGVALEGVGNVSAAGVLAKLLAPKLFGPIDAARAVRAVLVQDRDYTREPKAAALRRLKPHFFAVEAVWSRHSIEALFLDAPCLVQWLAPAAPKVGADALLGAIEAAVAVVDQDRELLEPAEDDRFRFHRRSDRDGKMLNERAALKAARDEVRSAPAVWQHGKGRAQRILAEIRKRLGSSGHGLRGSIVDIVSHADPGSISDLRLAIPEEISRLLDECVKP